MRKILCVALFIFTITALVPALAEAKITARKSPSTVACGVALKLGVTARNHTGSRQVKVRIYTGKRLVFKRTVRATKNFKKQLACGKSYRVVYRMPSGRKVTRKVKIRRGAGMNGQGLPASPALPIANGGSDDAPLTPAQEQKEEEEMDAMEACDALNEQHEDDDNWDPFACMGPDDNTDESGDDPVEDNENDEGDE